MIWVTILWWQPLVCITVCCMCCVWDSTHPAQPHVVAALLKLQGLQQLLPCLETSKTNIQSTDKQKQARFVLGPRTSAWSHSLVAQRTIAWCHSNKYHSPWAPAYTHTHTHTDFPSNCLEEAESTKQVIQRSFSGPFSLRIRPMCQPNL